jgi:hypothetical protein
MAPTAAPRRQQRSCRPVVARYNGRTLPPLELNETPPLDRLDEPAIREFLRKAHSPCCAGDPMTPTPLPCSTATAPPSAIFAPFWMGWQILSRGLLPPLPHQPTPQHPAHHPRWGHPPPPTPAAATKATCPLSAVNNTLHFWWGVLFHQPINQKERPLHRSRRPF